MAVYFNADEVFEMAEEIERNGAKFYRKVAGKAAEVRGRDLLLRLAAMEDEHEKTFADMRVKLSKGEQTATTFDPDNEAAQYLHAMAGGYVFDTKAKPDELLTGEETMTDILQRAIGLEKDSIVFYLGIKDMVPEWLGKDKVDDIIREERGHIVILSDELKALRG
ncbi:MAG: ferritin family protein [Planctomycetia bacterium]|nr:ferritin family protein [Planctomycetia bacterium]